MSDFDNTKNNEEQLNVSNNNPETLENKSVNSVNLEKQSENIENNIQSNEIIESNNLDNKITAKHNANHYSNYYRRNSSNVNYGLIFKYIALMLITSLLTSILVGGGLYFLFSRELKKQDELVKNTSIFGDQSSANTNSSVKNTSVNSSVVAKIASEVTTSIVGIQMDSKSSNQNNSFFDFGGNNSESNESISEGSGIILDTKGYILTNYHVVEYADESLQDNMTDITMKVYLSTGEEHDAEFIGGDSDTDLAVIKIESNDNLTAAKIGSSKDLNVGELAIAIGNPLGLEFAGTVTTGIISALNRSISNDLSSQNLIQTDAAINPGNSGGPLLNSDGEVVGINSSKIEQTGVEGIGFAIPIDDAQPIAEQLIEYGKVKDRPMIGIYGKDVSETIAESFNMHVGVYITEIIEDSGAEKSGLKENDIIIALAGEEVTTMAELNKVKSNYKAGDTVKIKIIRDNKEKTLDLTFSEE
jgi:serine protease Do